MFLPSQQNKHDELVCLPSQLHMNCSHFLHTWFQLVEMFRTWVFIFVIAAYIDADSVTHLHPGPYCVVSLVVLLLCHRRQNTTRCSVTTRRSVLTTRERMSERCDALLLRLGAINSLQSVFPPSSERQTLHTVWPVVGAACVSLCVSTGGCERRHKAGQR